MAPKAFIFLLNRGINFDKANYLITIPFKVEEIIKIDNYLFNRETKQYELTGIISICLKEDKYICFCKSFIDNKWYFYDDETILEQDFNYIELNTKNNNIIPYILLYKRI